MKAFSYSRGVRARALAVWLALLISSPSWLLAAVEGVPQLPNPGNAPLSRQQQEQLGQKAMAEVYQQMPILPDSNPVAQYIQQLGKRLDSVIPSQYNWPYQFHVVQESDINAFALPGGPIFVNLGTITAAENEAQLAGVLAHEMSHVYMQHSAKQMQKNQVPSILSGLGQVLGQMIGGVGGAIASIGGQLGGGMLSMRYSRADEAQADSVGAIIAYKAGYDPRQMAVFFQTLEQKSGNGGPQFLSDHPNPGNRYQAVSAEVKNWPPRQFVTDTPQFARVRQDAQKVKAYTAQQIQQMAQSGQIRNAGAPGGVQAGAGTMGNVSSSEVMPSGSFQTYNGQAFSMDYPSNWQVSQDQQGGVTIAPPAGVTQAGIAYGALINGTQIQNATSFDSAVSQLVSGLVQQNPGMRAGATHNVTVNRVRGKSVDLLGQSPLGQNGQPLQEHDWLVALPYQQNALIYVVFVSPERDYSRLKPAFQQMLRTFHLNQ
jgi:Zn-dependent protease with chaperone function